MAQVYEHNRKTEDIITVRWVSLRATATANMKPPTPSYIEGENKKKVAPTGFIPKGATYQSISGEECALWG